MPGFRSSTKACRDSFCATKAWVPRPRQTDQRSTDPFPTLRGPPQYYRCSSRPHAAPKHMSARTAARYSMSNAGKKRLHRIATKCAWSCCGPGRVRNSVPLPRRNCPAGGTGAAPGTPVVWDVSDCSIVSGRGGQAYARQNRPVGPPERPWSAHGSRIGIRPRSDAESRPPRRRRLSTSMRRLRRPRKRGRWCEGFSIASAFL